MKKAIIIVVLLVVVGVGLYSTIGPKLEGNLTSIGQESSTEAVSSPAESTTVESTPASSAESVTAIPTLAPITLNETILLSSQKDSEQKQIGLIKGWSVIEDWGVWTDGNTATFLISSENLPKEFKIALVFQGFTSANHPEQSYQFFNVKDKLLKKANYKLGSEKKTVVLEMHKSSDVTADGKYIPVTIKMLNPITPKAAGLPAGDRLLGMGLYSIKVSS